MQSDCTLITVGDHAMSWKHASLIMEITQSLHIPANSLASQQTPCSNGIALQESGFLERRVIPLSSLEQATGPRSKLQSLRVKYGFEVYPRTGLCGSTHSFAVSFLLALGVVSRRSCRFFSQRKSRCGFFGLLRKWWTRMGKGSSTVSLRQIPKPLFTVRPFSDCLMHSACEAHDPVSCRYPPTWQARHGEAYISYGQGVQR